jgi:ubiquilin
MSEITVHIKCSNSDKAEIKIELSATVLSLKEKIAEVLSVPASQQRLIYKGRVLKDESTLENYDVQDGHTVHMVKGAAAANASNPAVSRPTASSNPAPAPAAAPAAAPNAFPNPFAPNANNANPFMGGANPFMGGMGGGANPFGGLGGGFPDMSRMQEQLMRNPEMMQQIMNSPMMEDLMNNPDIMRNMMLNNPQMQALLDANPQIRHILNDPAVSLLLSSCSLADHSDLPLRRCCDSRWR